MPPADEPREPIGETVDHRELHRLAKQEVQYSFRAYYVDDWERLSSFSGRLRDIGERWRTLEPPIENAEEYRLHLAGLNSGIDRLAEASQAQDVDGANRSLRTILDELSMLRRLTLR